MKINKKKVIVLVFVVIIGVITLINIIEREKVLSTYLKQAEDICKDYNLYNFDISINYDEKYSDIECYELYFKGYSSMETEKLYEFVKSIDGLTIEHDSKLLFKRIYMNGFEYEVDGPNNKNLLEDGEVVYTYRSKEDEAFIESLKDRLPYENLAEEYIGYTKLGVPDEKEYHKTGMKARVRYTTYKWFDDNGNLEAVANVKEWDFKEKKIVPGYIFDITVMNYDYGLQN